MRLEKWALIAEIISAITIVISLIFVGLQVRQGADETALNTRAIETSAYQDLTAQHSELNSLVIQYPHVADLYQRIIVDRGEPETALEYQQIRAYLLMAYRQGEMAFRQFETGLIDEAGLTIMLAPVRSYIETPVGGEIWRRHSALEPSYREYVEALPPLGPVLGRE